VKATHPTRKGCQPSPPPPPGVATGPGGRRRAHLPRGLCRFHGFCRRFIGSFIPRRVSLVLAGRAPCFFKAAGRRRRRAGGRARRMSAWLRPLAPPDESCVAKLCNTGKETTERQQSPQGTQPASNEHQSRERSRPKLAPNGDNDKANIGGPETTVGSQPTASHPKSRAAPASPRIKGWDSVPELFADLNDAFYRRGLSPEDLEDPQVKRRFLEEIQEELKNRPARTPAERLQAQAERAQ
jgi:hypothetical protein